MKTNKIERIYTRSVSFGVGIKIGFEIRFYREVTKV